ncbi:MAG: helix-turn-helix transcriptional regulator [Gemmatimonadota bacterium]
MPERVTKLQRWLDLVAYLAGRRFPATLEDLREHVPSYALAPDAPEREKETVRRMFERDKDELRALGIPIETVVFSINAGAEHQQGYRLSRRNFQLPYLRLLSEEKKARGMPSGVGGTGRAAPSDAFELGRDEAAAALSGLQEVARMPSHPLAPHARSAFRKLAFDLDPDVAHPDPVVFARDPEALATRGSLQRLSDAVLARKMISFDYHSMGRDEVKRRAVRPYGLIFQHGRWYLVGHDEDRGAVRMFRVGRMSSLEPATARPATADFDVPADFELSDYGGRKAWELAEGGSAGSADGGIAGNAAGSATADGEGEEAAAEITALFRFPRSLWAERNGYGSLVGELSDGAQLRSFQVRRADPFLRWLLSLAPDARVTSPPTMKEAFEQMAAAVVARYEIGEDGGAEDE